VTTPELTIRLVGILAGSLLAITGAVLAHISGEEDGCLPVVLVIAGLLMAAGSFPYQVF
jgi:VIT1/CCC1 family predicted Fe2+/Mn2+ transporter